VKLRSPCAVLLAVVFCAACNSKKQPPVSAHSVLADSADQVMWGARFNLTDKGLQRAELFADTAFFFNDNTRVELSNVHTTFFTSTGAKNAVLTSRTGTYTSRNGGMVARKNVVVVSEDGRHLTTEELAFDQTTNQISSDSAFVLTEPNRRLEGVGFRSDPGLNNVRVLRGASGFANQVKTSASAPPAASH
jgi:LPS export ABC transporter protein LptC